MRHHQSRIEKMEKVLNVNRKNDGMIVILPDYSVNLIEAGFFKDEQEKEDFLTWRVAKLREPPFNDPIGVYLFNENDVQEYIEAFKRDSSCSK